MSFDNGRKIFFNPVSGEIRFDYDYNIPNCIPDSISWPMDEQRQNKDYGFKNLTLALTMNCNLSCDYCWQKRGDSRDMEIDTINYWLSFFLDDKKNSPNKILYYGGEPLLRIDLIEYASKQMHILCKKRDLSPVKQHIFTNATLLTDESLDILQRENIFLILSVDGSPQINSLHRKTPDGLPVDRLIAEGVNRLHSRGMKFGVCCTLSDAEFDLESTVGYILDEIRPDSIELNIRHDAGFCKVANRYTGKKLYSFYEAWDRIGKSNVLNVDLRKRVESIANRSPLQNSSSGSKNKLSVMPDGMISSFNGAVSFEELQIKPVGEWINCFKNRWNRNILKNAKCSNCRAAFICGQGSAFSSYLQYGDFNHAPALHCEYCDTILDYILDTIKRELVKKREIPFGYVVTTKDIKESFPNLFIVLDK